jgi:TonB family protein
VFSTQAGVGQTGGANAGTGVPSAPGATGDAATTPRRGNWIVMGWAAGVLLSMLRLAAGVAMSAWMRWRSEPIEGWNSTVPLLRSERAAMPMAVGIWRPAILLPRDAQDWSGERRRIVVSHELAHVRRHDCLVQLVARVAWSLYWFHPLAWVAARQMVKERERASDDLVLDAGIKPSDYAAELLEVARSFRPVPAAAWATVAMARRSQLEGRLLAILDSRARRGVMSARAVLATGAAVLALVLPLAAMRPAPQAVQAEEQVVIADPSTETDYTRLDKAARTAWIHHKIDEVQRLYERALELRKQKFGEKSPEYAQGLIHLARLEEALAIQEAALGANHPEVATTLYLLGLHAQGRKEFERASQLFQRALDIRTKSLGPSDVKVAEVLTSMGSLQEAAGKSAEGEQFYRRALTVADASGKQSPEAASAMEHYGRLLQTLDRASEAEVLLERAREIRKARVAAMSPRSVSADGAKPLRVGGDVRAPKLLYKVEPEYSEQARAAKYQGRVVLYIEVGTDGVARNIQLRQSLGFGLDEKAVEALTQWRFQPGTRDGQPVVVAATVEVNFRLL